MNIALDEIKSKAPEGATHYYEDGNVVVYIRRTPKNWYYKESVGGRWWKVSPFKIGLVRDYAKPL